MRIIGIDPGKSGGIAFIDGEGLFFAEKYTPENLIRNLRHTPSRPDKVYVERVHAMPGQGVTSMFTFGEGFGEIIGILKAMGVDYELVTPQIWKKHHNLIGKNKNGSIIRAMSLYPDWDFRPSQRARTPSDGICEAVLIARYGYDIEHEKEVESQEDDDYFDNLMNH